MRWSRRVPALRGFRVGVKCEGLKVVWLGFVEGKLEGGVRLCCSTYVYAALLGA